MDIKPNKIMVDGSGAACAFGSPTLVCRAYETESTVSLIGAVAGTPGYIAPELFSTPPSQASDLFALGSSSTRSCREKPTQFLAPTPITSALGWPPKKSRSECSLIAGCSRRSPAPCSFCAHPRGHHPSWLTITTQAKTRRSGQTALRWSAAAASARLLEQLVEVG